MRLVAILSVVSIVIGFNSLPAAEDFWTFDKVWYRGEKRPSMLKAFKKSGTLEVYETHLQFRAKDLELQIPISSIRSVAVESMKGDSYNRWAVVKYEEGGGSFVVGFKDGGAMGHGTDSVAIRDTIQTMLAASRDAAPKEDTPVVETAGASAHSDPSMTWKEFRKHVKEGFPPAPKTLVTDPSRVGVLLIDGKVKQSLSTYGIDGVGLVRTDDESRVYRAGPLFDQNFNGVAMFTGLEPGEYGVRIVRASNVQGWIALETPAHPDLTFRIKAGRVHYYGRFKIKGKHSRPTVELLDDPEREAAILRRFAERYSESPWATLTHDGRPNPTGEPTE